MTNMYDTFADEPDGTEYLTLEDPPRRLTAGSTESTGYLIGLARFLRGRPWEVAKIDDRGPVFRSPLKPIFAAGRGRKGSALAVALL